MDSTASSIVTTLGAGSGINMTQLASDLATAQFAARVDRLTQKSETLTEQISTASTIKNGLLTLASSFGDRVRTGDLASAPRVANSSVASASLPIGSIGRGSYSLEVSQLAEGQVISSPAFGAASDVVGAGTLTLRFGAMDGATFTEDTNQAQVDITIASGSTLTDIAGAINASGSGVTAYISQTVDGPRLVFKGAEGEANGFIIEATETVGEEGLAALAWEPTTGDAAQLIDTSKDAFFELDGLQMQSASNDTGQIAPGLKLNLTGTNIGNPTQITFSNPTDGIATAMSDFVTALNEIAAELNRATNIQTGELRGDPGARALKRAFSELGGKVVMPTATGDAPRTLSDLGLAIQRDGTFRIDQDRLNATLERDPEGAAAMFTTGLFGVYSTLDKVARDAGSTGNPGSLGGSIARYEKQVLQVSEQSAELLEKQEDLRTRMIARFAKADSRIAASQSTLTFLQQQVAAWNADNN